MKWNSNQVLSWFSGFHVVDWVFFKLHIAVCPLRESFFFMVQF